MLPCTRICRSAALGRVNGQKVSILRLLGDNRNSSCLKAGPHQLRHCYIYPYRGRRKGMLLPFKSVQASPGRNTFCFLGEVGIFLSLRALFLCPDFSPFPLFLKKGPSTQGITPLNESRNSCYMRCCLEWQFVHSVWRDAHQSLTAIESHTVWIALSRMVSLWSIIALTRGKKIIK